MSMTYNVRQVGSVTVVELGGRISLGEAIAFGPGSGVELHKVIRDLAKSGHKNILLNCRDVSYVDSSGIGELFGSFTTVRNQGGTLKITRVNERLQNIFALTKLNTVIEVIQDETAALRSFGDTVEGVSAA